MLCLLRNYIKKYRAVSITQISREFVIDVQALKPMLDIWVKKGIVRAHNHPLSCKDKCNSCNTNDLVYYCWVD